MRSRSIPPFGYAVLWGLLFGLLNYLTLGLTLPGSAAVVAIRPQAVVPLLAGFMMGPLHGFIVGCLGNFLGDWLCGFGFGYWPFSVGNGIIGMAPGLLKWRGVRDIETVGQFTMLLVLIVAGNVLGIGVGMLVFQAAAGDSMQQLTWAFFHPIIVANIIMDFMLMPILLFLFKRMPVSFDNRLCASLMYLLMAVVLAVIYLLNYWNARTMMAGLDGQLAAEDLAALMRTATLNSFRFGGTIGIAAILGAVAIAFGLIQFLAGPVRLLARAARNLKDGQLDEIRLDSLARRHDDFGRLAGVFQEAVSRVREREERLKQAIRELRLEINRDQESRQVSEITETDYFRSLQQRSLELRAKKGKNRYEKEQHPTGAE